MPFAKNPKIKNIKIQTSDTADALYLEPTSPLGLDTCISILPKPSFLELDRNAVFLSIVNTK